MDETQRFKGHVIGRLHERQFRGDLISRQARTRGSAEIMS